MLAQQKYLHMQHSILHILAFPQDLCLSFSLHKEGVCPLLPLLALHLFQPLPKLWMQQFRAAGSALAKLSPDASTDKTTSIYYYWRNLTTLEAWTPHEQPIARASLASPSALKHHCSYLLSR